jgi:uncharacterized protein (TIGR03435 family)
MVNKLTLVLCVTGAAAIVAAQDAALPSFEVATVKVNKSGDAAQVIRRQPGGRVTATNMPVRTLITFAYQLAQFQLVGGPSWIATDRFDIVAKMEGEPPPVAPGSGPDQIMLATRTLLADRFGLKVHRETREMDIYALVLARPGAGPGPGLKPSTTDCAALGAARRGGPPPGPPGPPPPGAPFCGIMGGVGSIRFDGFPLSQMATMLAGQAGRMVVDRTGLTGNWSFTLTYAPEQRGAPPAGATPPGAEQSIPDPNAPSLFTALQEQLGLKLESAKGPVEVVVIDAINKPTEE